MLYAVSVTRDSLVKVPGLRPHGVGYKFDRPGTRSEMLCSYRVARSPILESHLTALAAMNIPLLQLVR